MGIKPAGQHGAPPELVVDRWIGIKAHGHPHLDPRPRGATLAVAQAVVRLEPAKEIISKLFNRFQLCVPRRHIGVFAVRLQGPSHFCPVRWRSLTGTVVRLCFHSLVTCLCPAHVAGRVPRKKHPDLSGQTFVIRVHVDQPLKHGKYLVEHDTPH